MIKPGQAPRGDFAVFALQKGLKMKSQRHEVAREKPVVGRGLDVRLLAGLDRIGLD
jgi:hypothetical protein